jgi:tetratricopeptide (TPR) repeat protein
LEAEGESIAVARALAELAVLRELLEEDGPAIAAAEAALLKDPGTLGMHTLLRRKKHARDGRSALPEILAHLDAEIAEAEEGLARVSLLAERARILSALGRNDDALAAWSHVLAHDPAHPAALRGKEAALERGGDSSEASWAARADHLDQMAEAAGEDARAAAWLLVERAAILELRLHDTAGARRALTRALALDPRVGPVRRALVRHVARHRDAAALIDLLDEEGRLETNSHRAARLELEAASIAIGATGETGRAVLLLERAASRAPTTRAVDLRVLADLVRLLEGAGKEREAARWRRARLELLPEGAVKAEELRALARAAERAGDLDQAISDLETSLKEEEDVPTLGHLDRLMGARGRNEARVSLWVTDAARTTSALQRVTSLLRAADIAERALGRVDEAIRHLRTAWTVKPGHPEVLDALSRLLARPTPDAETRPRVELYAHAAEVAEDGVRRIAYLERVALLAEESLGDFARAVLTYEQILRIEPARMSALLGLARNAARARDDRALHRALLAQAGVTRSETDALALRTRAATAILGLDPGAALSLVNEVLEADGSHVAARALVTRINEEAERWELVARSLEEELPHVPASERRRVLLYLAEVEEVHLRAPEQALATLRRARETEPEDPRILARIARVLERVTDARALREAYESLAGVASKDDERAEHLIRSAEISEHQLKDDAAARRAYEEALIASPSDARIPERLERVRSRGERAYADPSIEPLDHATDLVLRGEDPARARALLETALASRRAPFASLRLLERLNLSAGDSRELCLVLAQEAEALRAPGPKLGALWALAELEEWHAETAADHLTYGRILALDPDDPEALLATVRTRLPAALRGDESARRAVIEAERRRAVSTKGAARATADLRLALLLEGEGGAANEAAATIALECYKSVVAFDPASVTAAWGMRRLGHRLGRAADTVHASTVLAELAAEPKARARHFVEAAELVLATENDAELGGGRARAKLAATLLERALAASADSVAAARTLVSLRTQTDERGELLRVLRDALGRASEKDAIIFLGTEVARLARDDAHELGVATQAMRRILEVAPTHASSLLTLAELYLAQRAWPEAVETLEAVVVHSAEADPRLTALFALGSIYEKVLARPDEHERVLRVALSIEPESPRALRGLIDMLRGKRAGKESAPTPEATAELASLLGRLARAEKDPAKQSETYLEVSDLEALVGDHAAAQRSILRAILVCPSSARAFARLAAFFRGEGGLDAAGYARALQDLISRGREHSITDPRWFAALGQLEIDTLQRLHEGVAHLEWAVQLDPSLHETRFELADAYLKTGAKENAEKALLALITPDARALAALADGGMALSLLEQVFEQEKRPMEAAVVSEMRAVLGELEPSRAEYLKGISLGVLSDDHEPLGRQTLVESVLPKAGRHVLLEVGAASTGLDVKILRASLAEIGVHARDRARSGHPLRIAFDRVVTALGVGEIELVVSPAIDKVRLIVQDTPWLLVPSVYEQLPFGVQVAAFGRAVTRALLGVPWAGEIRDSAFLGWLIAVARQVTPGYAMEGDAPPEAVTYEPQVAKAIGRRQRKLLEPLAMHLVVHEGRPPDLAQFLLAIEQCGVRAAYLLSGEITSVAHAVAREDRSLKEALSRPGLPALTTLLGHPLLGDTIRFALTQDATSLRKRLGSAWR